MKTQFCIRWLNVAFLTAALTVTAQTPPPSGLKLWLKADALTGLNDGDKVATWLDSSGSGNAATNPAVANQPTYVASGLNGLPAVRFNDSANGTPPAANSGQWLDSPTTVNANNADFTAIVVFNSRPTAGLRDNILQPLDAPNGAFGRTVLYVEPLAAPYTSSGKQVLQSFASQLGVQGAGQYVSNSWTLATVWQSISDDRLALFRDGRLVGARPLAGAQVNTNGFWRIGDNKPRTGGLNGEVAEVLVYNRAITAAERIAIEGYLATKYGLLLASNILTDTFDTPDTFDLTADLATRQSGAAAPSSTYFSTQDGLTDVIEIKTNQLSITLQDTASSYSTAKVSPGDPLGSHVVNGRFSTSMDLRPHPAPSLQSWSGLKVASSGSLSGVPGGDGFSWIIFGAGAFQAFDGPTLAGNLTIPAANQGSRYTVCTVFDGAEYSCSVNGLLMPLNYPGTNVFNTLANGAAANFATFNAFADTNNMPATATYDNFTLTTFPEVALPATVILADNYNTADTNDLNIDVASRQTGTAAPAGYLWAAAGGATVAIEGNGVKITNPDSVFSYAVFCPNVDFLPYERSQSFRLRFKVTPTAVGTVAAWAGLKIRDAALSTVATGTGFSYYVKADGGWQAFQGTTLLASGAVAAAATYDFDLEVRTNALRLKVNGAVVLNHTMPSGAQNYVSLMALAGTELGGPLGVTATFDDFEFAALGPAPVVPAPTLVNIAHGGGVTTFDFNSVNGIVYIVEYKDDLTAPTWSTLGNAFGTGGTVTVTDNTAGSAQRFYRLRVP